MRPVGSAEQLAGRRLAAAKMFEQGWTAAEVSRALQVAYSAAWKWREAWRRDGVAALAPKERPPRKRKLTRRQLARLQTVICRGAVAAGFPDDTWTCPRVRNWIEKTFGVTYHVDHLPKLLRTLQLTPQQPQRRAVERDEAKVRRFRKRDWPRIKKGGSKASKDSSH